MKIQVVLKMCITCITDRIKILFSPLFILALYLLQTLSSTSKCHAYPQHWWSGTTGGLCYSSIAAPFPIRQADLPVLGCPQVLYTMQQCLAAMPDQVQTSTATGIGTEHSEQVLDWQTGKVVNSGSEQVEYKQQSESICGQKAGRVLNVVKI